MNYLFIINGFGLGNSFRSSLLIRELLNNTKQKTNIDIVASGNSYLFFENTNLPISTYIQNEFKLKQRKNQFYSIKTIVDIMHFFKNVISNGMIQKSLINKKQYDFIFIDSDYSSFYWKLSTNVKTIAINNSPLILHHKKNILTKKYLFQYLMEYLEYKYFTTFCDYILCPTFHESHLKNNNPLIINYPFLLKGDELRGMVKINNELRQLVFLKGGSGIGNFSELIDVKFLRKFNLIAHVVGEEGESTPEIIYWGKIFGLPKDEILKFADILIINGGIGSVSEALILKKPTVAFPINGHFEQLINIILAQKISTQIILSNPNTLCKSIEQIIENLDSFCKNKNKDDFTSHSNIFDKLESLYEKH